jgi:hypothetical protein
LREEPLPDEFWLGFWNSVSQKRGNMAVAAASSRFITMIRWAAMFAFAALIVLYGRDLPETAPPGRQAGTEVYPVIENIENPEARYYIFQSSEQQKIVMVYDPDIEL